MTAGIEIRGSHGFIQITDKYANLALRQKAVVGLDANGKGAFSFVGETPFVCVQSASPIALLAAANSGQAWTMSLSGGPGAVATMFVFDGPTNIGSTAGLQVFRESDGKLMFDAMLPYLKVVGAVSPPVGQPAYAGSWEGNPLPPGSYAACLSYTRTGQYSIPDTDVLYVADHVYTTATGAGLALRAYGKKGIWDEGDGVGLAMYGDQPPQILLVDVSQL